MTETTNEPDPTSPTEDVDGQSYKRTAVPENTDDVDGHIYRWSAVPENTDDVPEADGTEGQMSRI